MTTTEDYLAALKRERDRARMRMSNWDNWSDTSWLVVCIEMQIERLEERMAQQAERDEVDGREAA